MATLSLNPSPELTLLLLDELIDPELSMRAVANRHQTSVAALSLWLARPEIAEQLAAFHSTFADRTRVLATCNLSTAIAGLTRLIERFIESDSNPDPTLTPDQRQRARESARRASTALIKLSDFRPVPLGTMQPVRAAASGNAAATSGSGATGGSPARADLQELPITVSPSAPPLAPTIAHPLPSIPSHPPRPVSLQSLNSLSPNSGFPNSETPAPATPPPEILEPHLPKSETLKLETIDSAPPAAPPLKTPNSSSPPPAHTPTFTPTLHPIPPIRPLTPDEAEFLERLLAGDAHAPHEHWP